MQRGRAPQLRSCNAAAIRSRLKCTAKVPLPHRGESLLSQGGQYTAAVLLALYQLSTEDLYDGSAAS